MLFTKIQEVARCPGLIKMLMESMQRAICFLRTMAYDVTLPNWLNISKPVLSSEN